MAKKSFSAAQFVLAVVAAVGLAAGAWAASPANTNQGANAAPKFVTSASGLKYADLEVGSGPQVKTGMKVLVDYEAWLADGTKFDSSYDRREPFAFTIGAGQVIQGWEEGVVGMRVGGKRKLVIPPALAYGETGAPPRIPPNATLTFEVKALTAK